MANSPRKNYVAREPAPVMVDPAPMISEPIAYAPIEHEPARAPVTVPESASTMSDPVAHSPIEHEPAPAPVAVLEPVAVAMSREVTHVAQAAAEKVEKMVKDAPVSITALHEKFRTMIEKNLAETRSNYVKAKNAADEATSAFEASYSTAKSGYVEMNAKAMEALRATAEANFGFMKSIIGVKSMADYVALHTEFARKQVEMMSGTSKEFGALAKKIAEQSVEPIKAQVAKTFKIAV